MKMEHVVRMAMKGCFAEQLVVRPIPLTGTVQLQSRWPSCSRFQDPEDLLLAIIRFDLERAGPALCPCF